MPRAFAQDVFVNLFPPGKSKTKGGKVKSAKLYAIGGLYRAKDLVDERCSIFALFLVVRSLSGLKWFKASVYLQLTTRKKQGS